MHDPIVEIEQSGRGGSIYYRADEHSITFGWEFATPPALALIFGPTSQVWESEYPWAKGRQREIFEFVGAEVVRQKAPGYYFDYDVESGVMAILKKSPQHRAAARAKKRGAASPPKHSPAYEKFLSSVVPIWEQWRDDQTYDVAAIAKMTAGERKEVFGLLTGRDVTWREVEALAAIDTPEARAAVDEASKHHLSIDTRLAAAEAMHRQGRLPDLDSFLAKQIRQLYQLANGLRRALLLAERHPSETVKQALLWASTNQTECAPECAKLLLALTGAAEEPFDAAVEQMLEKLGLHNSYFDRKAAFDELCRRVAMQLDPEAAY
jgi:hypothetical protein